MKKKISLLEGASEVIQNKTIKVILYEKIRAYKECLEVLDKIIGALES